jgi:glycolate oxidase iron-sulfur subunit
VIAAGNIGCITQLGTGTDIPVLHTVELIDWATGGPVPEAVKRAESLDAIATRSEQRAAEPVH